VQQVNHYRIRSTGDSQHRLGKQQSGVSTSRDNTIHKMGKEVIWIRKLERGCYMLRNCS
jgi:hypothetical protein